MVSRTDLETWEDNQARKRRTRDGEGQQGVDFVTKLGAAKHALALTEEVPDLVDLLDHGEAVRAAAKKLHISAKGINAWTRFCIDSERKAWARIEAMREAGELVVKGRPSKSANMASLKDFIDRRPNERSAEWSLLAKLTEYQLDEIERIANEEDRLLTREELFRLAKAGIPGSTEKPDKIRNIKELEVIARAQEIAASDGFVGEIIQIDDDAKVNKAEKGWWVEAYVFIEDELTRSDYDQD